MRSAIASQALPLLLVLMAAFVPAHSDAAPRTFADSDKGAQARLKVGETFVIRLRSNPSTGYMWSVAPESADLVSLTGTSSTEPPKNGMVGQPIFQIFDFKAVKRGSGVLALHYVRSWEKPAADETRFTLRITVR